jgi:glc operon protein GlcG
MLIESSDMKPLLLAMAVLAVATPAWAQTPPTPAPAAAPAQAYGAPIGLEAAQALVDRAVEAGRARGFRLAIAVVEPSGALVAFGRMDDVPVRLNRRRPVQGPIRGPVPDADLGP